MEIIQNVPKLWLIYEIAQNFYKHFYYIKSSFCIFFLQYMLIIGMDKNSMPIHIYNHTRSIYCIKVSSDIHNQLKEAEYFTFSWAQKEIPMFRRERLYTAEGTRRNFRFSSCSDNPESYIYGKEVTVQQRNTDLSLLSLISSD